jgi:hypothetical protein
MTDNELLAVMDREAELLTADNWHAAASVMREAAELVRRLTRTELRFTKQDIESWLAELGQEHQQRDYDPKFKFGVQMGLTSLMARLDQASRSRSAETR